MISSEENGKKRIREFIPLYVQGGLDPAGRKEVERAVLEDAELRRELDEWRIISNGYRHIDGALPEPQPDLFDKVAARVQKREKRGLLAFLPSPPPRLAWGVVALQFAIILFLGVQFAGHFNQYRTLSVPEGVVKGDTRINVVFRENATEAEIRRLLLSIEGKLADGPSTSRCYVVTVPSSQGADSALDKLRGSGIVLLAEIRH